ncbi:MAG: putative lipid II flippase FtsW [Chthoniobacterales bacterium]
MQRNCVYLLLLSVFGLIVLGMVMLFSTSAFARDSHGNIYYFVKRQGIWLGIGVVVCILAAITDYNFWKKTWAVWFGIAAVLLVLCFVPHIGMKINGSRRWINLGIMSFQPSELAKVASVMFLAWWYSRYEKESGTFLRGMVYPAAIVGILMLLIVSEQDLGSTLLIGLIMVAIMFVAGGPMKILAPILIGGIASILFVATRIPERMARLLAFLYPEKYLKTEFHQQYQGLIAFGAGGPDGLGLGEGRQKIHYLPYAHTDFIFPVIGEELGLRFTLLIVFAFLIIALCGCLIAANARDRFGSLLGFGIVMLLTVQAAINISVTTALMPNKGMPLPFISYGGSNLLLCLFMVGILISIHRHGKFVER